VITIQFKRVFNEILKTILLIIMLSDEINCFILFVIVTNCHFSGYGGRSCCKNSDLDEYDTIINQKLGSFQRILRGDSFRIHSIQVSAGSLPPSRVLDMAVNVYRDTHELEFTWTAPGDDYDHG
jgi:hypothetical protein